MGTRRERVIFAATDNLSPAMLRMAAAAKVLDESLDGVHGSTRRVGGTSHDAARNVGDLDRSFRPLPATVNHYSREVDRAEVRTRRLNSALRDSRNPINLASGRLTILGSTLAATLPMLSPLGVGTAQLLSGVASQAGFAVTGLGTMLVAFQGVGSALKAVNEAALEPTVANMQAARLAMEELSPEARAMVREVASMGDSFKDLRNSTSAAMFPGMIEGLRSLDKAGPRVTAVFAALGQAIGEISADTGASLAGPRWAELIDFIGTEGPTALKELAAATGNTVHALGGLWMAMAPANDDFSKGLVDMTERFDDWANSLSATEGFQEFLDYMQTAGPQVLDTLGALSMAIVDILTAAAPLGGPTLKAFELFAETLSAIANSPLGTPIMALLQLAAVTKLAGMAAAGASSSYARFGASTAGSALGVGRVGASFRGVGKDMRQWLSFGAMTRAEMQAQQAAGRRAALGIGKMGGAAALTAAALSPLPEKFGLTNTAMGAMIGMMAGPWGAAAGAVVGGALDMKAGIDKVSASLDIARKAASNSKASLEELEAGFAKAADARKDAGNWMTKVSPLYGAIQAPKRREAETLQVELAGKIDAQRAAADLDLLTSGFARTSAGAREAAMSMKDFTGVLAEMMGLLDAGAAADKLTQSLRAMKGVLRETGGQWQGNSAAALKSREALREVGRSAVEVAKNIEDPARASASLGKARDRFLATAKAAGVGAREARKMADSIGLIPRTKRVDLMLKTGGALGVLTGIRAGLNAIRSKDVTVRVHRVMTGGLAGMLAGNADGGTVGGAPRRPYGDKVLTMLAPGEEVISNRNGQADRHRALLKAINAGRYADGGTVGGYISDGIEDAEFYANGGTVKRRKGKRGGTARERGLKRLHAASDAAAANLDAMSASLDGVRSTADGLAGTIRDGLTRSVGDIMSGNPWVSAGDRSSGIFSGLRADIAKANLTRALGAQLAGAGITGDALASLYEAGPMGMQAIAGLGASGMAQYQALFNERAALAAAASSAGSGQAYGAQIAVLQAEVNRLTVVAKQAKKAVEVAKGSARAFKEGNQKASKQAAHKRRQRAGRR